jgi:hypothetical protein
VSLAISSGAVESDIASFAVLTSVAEMYRIKPSAVLCASTAHCLLRVVSPEQTVVLYYLCPVVLAWLHDLMHHSYGVWPQAIRLMTAGC